MGEMPCFSSSRLQAVRAMDTASSRSPQKARPCWPSPTVYLPLGTPSCFSSSSCRTWSGGRARED